MELINGQWEVADVTEARASSAGNVDDTLELTRTHNKRPARFSEPTEYTAEEWLEACKKDEMLGRVGREAIRCHWGGPHGPQDGGLSMREAAKRLREVADRLEGLHDEGFRMGNSTTVTA